MAGNSVIGALRVDLGLNSAQFTTGLKKATGALSKFGIQTTLSLETVANQLGRVIGAIPRAIKASIDHADALSKASQKAGTTVEALSRLEYAAKLSDVSLESLTGGLQKLSKSMADSLISKTSTAATAFKALSIEIRNSDGSLRDSNDVLADVADRFSRMEDGATKTSLAMMLFGKSGAELIPLLNEGADGLQRLADESDRTGNTINTKTAKAAEKFNDTLTRLSEIMKGVMNQLMEAVLPTLQGLADTLMQVDPQLLAVATGIGAITLAATLAAPAVGTLAAAMKGLYSTLALIAALPGGVLALATGFYLGSTSPVGAGEDALVKQLGLTRLPTGSAFTGGWGSKPVNDITVHGGNKTPFVPGAFTDQASAAKAATDAAKAMDDQLKAMNADLASQKEAWEELQQPVRDMASAIGDTLSGALSGMISDLMAGKNAVGGLLNAFKSLGDRLIQMALDNAIQGLLGNLLGAAFGGGGGLGVGKGLTGAATYGFTGNGIYGIPSFAGGGFTGTGSRGGGIDGMGGFAAVLHPNETVVDHAAGQGGFTFSIGTIIGSKEDAAANAKAMRREAWQMYREMQKNPDRTP